MTQYSDLCNAYGKATEKFNLYMTECEILAEDIWNTMLDFHLIPPAQLGLFKFDENGESEQINGPIHSAMRMLEDAFFEFGIGISLQFKSVVSQYETIVLPILVSKDIDGNYHAKAGVEGKDFTIDRSKKEDITSFTEFVLQAVMEEYEQGLSDMIRKNTIRKVGFGIKGLKQ